MIWIFLIFFIHFAIKTKFHLNQSRIENFDRSNFLNFWNTFFFCERYDRIKFKHFKKKTIHVIRIKRKKNTISSKKLILKIVKNEMNWKNINEFNDTNENLNEYDYDDNCDDDDNYNDNDNATINLNTMNKNIRT